MEQHLIQGRIDFDVHHETYHLLNYLVVYRLEVGLGLLGFWSMRKSRAQILCSGVFGCKWVVGERFKAISVVFAELLLNYAEVSVLWTWSLL